MSQLKQVNPVYRNPNSTNLSTGVPVLAGDLNTVIDEVNSQDTRIEALENGGSTFTELSIQGDATVGFGLLELKSKTSSVTFGGGATETIPIQIPATACVVAAQLRNDTILVGAGAANYTVTTTSTSFTIPSTGSVNFSKNTKTNIIVNNVQSGIIDDLILTPDAGTLDTGTVTAVVYYWELTSLTDAP